MRKFMTSRFGEIEVDDNAVITFESGIPAFEDEREFLLIPYEEGSPYVFLQSLRTSELAFLMTTPHVFFPDYEVAIDDDVERALGLTTPEEVLIYTILTLSGKEIRDLTANLMAPIVVNAKTHRARQIVLERSPYTTKHRLFPATKEDK